MRKFDEWERATYNREKTYIEHCRKKKRREEAMPSWRARFCLSRLPIPLVITIEVSQQVVSWEKAKRTGSNEWTYLLCELNVSSLAGYLLA